MEPDSWLGVELRHFLALEAVAREGSFGKAAASLGYTQSAVSQQIATLERIVGHRLPERAGGPKPVSLTEASRLLLIHADAIAARVAAAQADLTSLAEGQAGALRGGGYQRGGPRTLPRGLRRPPRGGAPRPPAARAEVHRHADRVVPGRGAPQPRRAWPARRHVRRSPADR